MDAAVKCDPKRRWLWGRIKTEDVTKNRMSYDAYLKYLEDMKDPK